MTLEIYPPRLKVTIEHERAAIYEHIHAVSYLAFDLGQLLNSVKYWKIIPINYQHLSK
jgi:hypothetical protein